MRAAWSIIISICLAVAAEAHASSLGAVVSEKSRSHELKPPDFFLFVVQYSRSVCEKAKCGQKTRANLPTAFSIHGLWEGMNDEEKPAPITSKDKFDLTKLAEMRGELDKYWFDALKFDKPVEYPTFWKHEWNRHGTRSGYNFKDYFATTVHDAYGKFRKEFDDMVRRNNKYLPGKEFKLNEFINSFGTTELAVPWARCHRHTNLTLLVTELVFRIDPHTGKFTSQTKNDDSENKCPTNDPNALGLLPSTAPII